MEFCASRKELKQCVCSDTHQWVISLAVSTGLLLAGEEAGDSAELLWGEEVDADTQHGVCTLRESLGSTESWGHLEVLQTSQLAVVSCFKQ